MALQVMTSTLNVRTNAAKFCVPLTNKRLAYENRFKVTNPRDVEGAHAWVRAQNRIECRNCALQISKHYPFRRMQLQLTMCCSQNEHPADGY